jgi:chitin disaccharide deacetylase
MFGDRRSKDNMSKYVIFNADDFGAHPEINRGIIECHTRGVVTSTSVMVTGRAVTEAVALSREHPQLAIGLHWDVLGEDERTFDLDDLTAVREEWRQQLDRFGQLFNRLPTHVDSHRHTHRRPKLLPLFKELVAPLGVPLRGDGQVKFIGGFYAQWEWGVTTLEYVGVPFLQKMLQTEVVEGWAEVSCHPGYIGDDYQAMYRGEREHEVRTLVDPAIRRTIEEAGIQLVSYAEFATLGPKAVPPKAS